MHIMKLVDGASFLLKRIIADFIKHPLSALNQVVSDAVLKLAIHKAEWSVRDFESDRGRTMPVEWARLWPWRCHDLVNPRLDVLLDDE